MSKGSSKDEGGTEIGWSSTASADRDLVSSFYFYRMQLSGHRRADPTLSLTSISAQKGSWPGSQAGSSPRGPVFSVSRPHPPLLESVSEDYCIPLYQYQPVLQTHCESRYHRREQMLGHRAVQQCTSPALECNFGYHFINSSLRNRNGGLTLSGEKLHTVRLLSDVHTHSLISNRTQV